MRPEDLILVGRPEDAVAAALAEFGDALANRGDRAPGELGFDFYSSGGGLAREEEGGEEGCLLVSSSTRGWSFAISSGCHIWPTRSRSLPVTSGGMSLTPVERRRRGWWARRRHVAARGSGRRKVIVAVVMRMCRNVVSEVVSVCFNKQ